MPDRSYQERAIVRAVLNQEWLIEPSKLDAICAFLELRASGAKLPEDQIQIVMQAGLQNPVGIEQFFNKDNEQIDVGGIRLIQTTGTMAPKLNLMAKFSGGASTQMLTREFIRAGQDDSVSTVLHLVDSPGGVATGTQEYADAIRQVSLEKPVFTLGTGMMTSAAFWAGTAAGRVFASPSTEIGSVGTVAIIRNVTKAAEEAGVKFEVFRAGQNKAVPNMYENMTDEQRALVQERIDGTNQSFLDGLAQNFGATIEHIQENFGQGAVFRAPEALRRGMIDRVVSLETLLDELLPTASTSVFPARMGSTSGVNAMTVTPKVKALLFAGDYIDSMDAEDSAVTTFLVSKDVPDTAGEAEVLGLIQSWTQTQTPTPAPAEPTATTVATTEPSEIDRQRFRMEQLQTIGELMHVSPKDLAEALASSDSVEEVRKKWVAKLADDQTTVSIVPGASRQEKLDSGLVNALLEKMGKFDLCDQGLAYGASFRNRTMMEIARETLQATGSRITGDLKTDAMAFLRMGMEGTTSEESAAFFETQINASGKPFTILSSERSYNRRGDHPDALSNLMGRMLDAAYDQAPVSYPAYARQLPNLPDFRPKSFIDSGVFDELDVRLEDEVHKQLAFDSELRAWMQADEYGNKVGLTTKMVIDDDLGLFGQQLQSLPFAAQKRLDNTCRSILTTNPTMLDGTALFATARGNQVSSGGAPTAASASEHRRLQRLIPGYGTTRPMNENIQSVLVPAALEEDALQVFARLLEPKTPATDATINTVRGLNLMVTVDANLDAYSATAWYTFAMPRLYPIGYAFLTGSGPQGVRKTWTDPDTGTRYVALDIAFAAAAIQWRGGVYNPGT